MNGVQLYLLSEKLMGIAGDAAPEGSALREFPPAARLVLADVGQNLIASEAEISRRTGLPEDYVRETVSDLAARGFLEASHGPGGQLLIMPGSRLPFGSDDGPLADAALAGALGTRDAEAARDFTAAVESLARRLRVGEVTAGDGQFDAAYGGTPPWETRRPQPAFTDLAEDGQIIGRVLDAGCGTGEHALLAAGLGLPALGVDSSPAAIALARRKAAERAPQGRVRFEVHDARDLGSLGERFDTVLDSGLFHVLPDEDRARYEASLRGAIAPGGRLFLLCVSDRQPPGFGPRRISAQEIAATFADGWRVEDIEQVLMDIALSATGVWAWLAAVTRI